MGGASSLEDVRTIGPILMAALFAPENIGYLKMIVSWQTCLPQDHLPVAIAITDLGRSLTHRAHSQVDLGSQVGVKTL